jgi:hypothetical protein
MSWLSTRSSPVAGQTFSDESHHEAGLEVVQQDPGLHPRQVHEAHDDPYFYFSQQKEEGISPASPESGYGQHRIGLHDVTSPATTQQVADYASRPLPPGPGPQKQSKRILGLSVLCFWIMIIIITVVIAVGLAVGLVFGLSAQNRDAGNK